MTQEEPPRDDTQKVLEVERREDEQGQGSGAANVVPKPSGTPGPALAVRTPQGEFVTHPKIEKPMVGFRITVAYAERILAELDRMKGSEEERRKYPETSDLHVAFDTQLRKWKRCEECNAPLMPDGRHA